MSATIDQNLLLGRNRIRKIFAVIFVVILAGVCSPFLLSGLQHVILPRGQQWLVMSPTESLTAVALFALWVCACAALVAAVGCYFRHWCAFVFLPMFVGAAFATVFKVHEFQISLSISEEVGLAATISLQAASLHEIPLTAFIAGLVAGLVALPLAFLMRKTND